MIVEPRKELGLEEVDLIKIDTLVQEDMKNQQLMSHKHAKVKLPNSLPQRSGRLEA